VSVKDPFERVARILEEMPPIGALGCVGSALRRALGVGLCPIARDDLDAGMLA
jgi:hypothetical protein